MPAIPTLKWIAACRIRGNYSLYCRAFLGGVFDLSYSLLPAWRAETAPTELPGLTRLTLTVGWNEGKRSLSLVQYQQKQK